MLTGIPKTSVYWIEDAVL